MAWSLLCFLLSAISAVLLNTLFKKVLIKWKNSVPTWFKSSILFLATLVFVPLIAGICQIIISLTGLEILGFTISNSFFIMGAIIFYIAINFAWFMIRLSKKRL